MLRVLFEAGARAKCVRTYHVHVCISSVNGYCTEAFMSRWEPRDRITEEIVLLLPGPYFQMKKKEELIVVDALLEEGINDGDSRHLCLDKTILLSSGHT